MDPENIETVLAWNWSPQALVACGMILGWVAGMWGGVMRWLLVLFGMSPPSSSR